jgi:fatty acid/phospholipid biosynthesis enzyme
MKNFSDERLEEFVGWVEMKSIEEQNELIYKLIETIENNRKAKLLKLIEKKDWEILRIEEEINELKNNLIIVRGND